MTNPPRVTPVPPKQLGTSKIKNLPPIPPRQRPLLAIRLNQPLPNTLLIAQHGRQPILTRLAIMHTANPPLPLDLQVVLKEQQKIGGRHRPPSEEMLCHPSAFEVVGCVFVREDMHEELASRFQGPGYFGHEQGIILHVLEELDGEDAVVNFRVEFMVYHVAGDDSEVLEAL